MFAYCNNNPVVQKDSNGNFPWVLLFLVASTVIGGIMGFCSDERLADNLVQNDESSADETNQDNDTASSEELTIGDRIENQIIGASLGLAASGGIVAVGGVVGSFVAGSATIEIAVFGATGLQTFAYGALAYDVFAIVFAPFYGLEMETIEFE